MSLEDKIVMAHKALPIVYVGKTSDYIELMLKASFRPTIKDVQLLLDIGLKVVFFADHIFVCEKRVS